MFKNEYNISVTSLQWGLTKDHQKVQIEYINPSEIKSLNALTPLKKSFLFAMAMLISKHDQKNNSVWPTVNDGDYAC